MTILNQNRPVTMICEECAQFCKYRIIYCAYRTTDFNYIHMTKYCSIKIT